MSDELPTFFEEWPVTEALNEACERWSGTPVAWEIATWTIVRDPNCLESKAVNEAGTLRVATFEGARSIEHPTIVLLYECSSSNLTRIIEADFKEPTASQAGRA